MTQPVWNDEDSSTPTVPPYMRFLYQEPRGSLPPFDASNPEVGKLVGVKAASGDHGILGYLRLSAGNRIAITTEGDTITIGSTVTGDETVPPDIQDYINSSIAEHEQAVEPHKAYDIDAPSFSLIFQNGLV
jgi:hypothetical protein